MSLPIEPAVRPAARMRREAAPIVHAPAGLAALPAVKACAALGAMLAAQVAQGAQNAQQDARGLSGAARASAAAMQPVGRFEIDLTEVTIGAFRAFTRATGTRTKAEREGAGLIYEAGWEKRAGWAWHSPYGKPGADDEPAVHVTHGEAQAYCRWAGKRLPTEAEWQEAAYTERRAQPPAPFVNGRTYAYPTGDTPQGANCLGDCGSGARPVAHAVTSRGRGHVPVGTTVAGVNGLFDMGANAWEWVDGAAGQEQPTMGGSWWYGSGPMQRGHRATKPADMAVVYIGFRCARSRD